MTEKILESDLDLARKLLAEDRADSEIIAALARRGVQPALAAEVVSDLRSGKTIPIRTAVSAEPAKPTPPEPQGPKPAGGASAGDASTSRVERRRRSTGHSRSRMPPALVWAMIPFVLILGIVTASVSISRHRSQGGDQAVAPTPPRGSRPAGAPADVANVVASNPAQRLSSHGLLIELRPDGLRVGGNLVNQQNTLQVLSELLGDATRTNRVPKSDRLVYAFDKHGIMVYAQPGSGADNIVLEFEALGSTNGTVFPFLGTFKAEAEAIDADTSAKKLAGLKSLALTNASSDSGIFGCQYNQLRLIFAYLKTPDHLSMVEIDLK